MLTVGRCIYRAVDKEMVNGCSWLYVAYAGPLTWNVESMFKVVCGVRRALWKYLMRVHARSWRMPGPLMWKC